jgi:hypothetical protein
MRLSDDGAVKCRFLDFLGSLETSGLCLAMVMMMYDYVSFGELCLFVKI